MSQIARYFAGGNTADGFVSFFPFVLPEINRKRMYFIKGGPGVGKSSFMKVIGYEMEQDGYDVEYFYCSGDPECLDAVSIPALGVGIMDATAPHAYDPMIPGARDTLISLGDYLDESAMNSYVSEIERINDHISLCYRNCYHYLRSAAELKLVTEEFTRHNQSDVEGIQISEYAGRLLKKYIFAEEDNWQADEFCIGVNRKLFGEAFTHLGYLSYVDALLSNRTALILEHDERKMDAIMQELMKILLRSGKDTISLHNPLMPDRISHLYVPENQLLFTSDFSLKDTAELCDSYHPFGNIYEHALQDRNYDELLQYAVNQLKSAKKAHDELETYYVKSMDFDGVSKKLNEVLTKIRTMEL